MSTVSGYFWRFEHPGWLGGPPDDWNMQRTVESLGSRIPESWKEVVVDRQLKYGPRFTAERWGLMRYDFSQWPPGVTEPDESQSPNFNQAVETTLRRLKLMNVHLLLLHAAYLELMNTGTRTQRVSHTDLIHFHGDGSSGPGLLQQPMLVGILDAARTDLAAVETEVLDVSTDWLDQLLKADPDASDSLDKLDLLHHGLAMFQSHDYAQALVAGWTLCEQLITMRWDTYLAERRNVIKLSDGIEVERMNSDRRRHLREDQPISTVLQILELVEELDHESFRRLDAVRHRRNRWMHHLERPDASSGRQSLSAAADLLTTSIGLPIRLSLGRTISMA